MPTRGGAPRARAGRRRAARAGTSPGTHRRRGRARAGGRESRGSRRGAGRRRSRTAESASRPPSSAETADGAGERTITVLGDKLVPRGGDDRLPWNELVGADAAYFVSGAAEALRQAR